MSLVTISLSDAKYYAAKWLSEGVVKTADLQAVAFPREVLEAILANTEVEEVRFYLGIKEQLPYSFAVGVDANGNDLLTGNHLIYNKSKICPMVCGQKKIDANGNVLSIL